MENEQLCSRANPPPHCKTMLVQRSSLHKSKLPQMKLLIVEDNLQMRRLLKQIMRRWCDPIFECEDGAAALSAYREHHPDWVLMDIEMPETDGISATRQIIHNFPEAKIAIVTDHDHASLREAATKAGARDYVLKEDLSKLRQVICQ